jgi:hypothetical protein
MPGNPAFKTKTAIRILIVSLKYNIFISEVFSLILFITEMFQLLLSKKKAADYLMKAHRTTRKLRRQVLLEKVLKKHDLLNVKILDSLIKSSDDDRSLYQKRVFVLKEKRAGERWVLIISFDVFGQLRKRYDMAKILADYHLILEPSRSGYCTPEILQFLEYQNARIIIQAAEKLDYDFITQIGKNLIAVDIGSSNRVDERVFTDSGLEKEYDCIMVAIWADFIRHHLLFKAIKKINDPTFRTCLIGKPWGGRTRRDIERMIEYYGIEKNVTIFEGITPEEVNVLLNKAKVNLLVSLKEGANRGILEGFFADTPGIVLKQNRGVNKSYINEYTGRLIEVEKLKDTLIWFRTNHNRFKPREWALRNISRKISTARLEDKLKMVAGELSEPWTAPIAIKAKST